jgi:hypothetical protein
VYTFSRFKVRPANRSFQSVRCDYQVLLEANSEAEEVTDLGGGPLDLKARLSFVPIDRLASFIGKKVCGA